MLAVPSKQVGLAAEKQLAAELILFYAYKRGVYNTTQILPIQPANGGQLVFPTGYSTCTGTSTVLPGTRATHMNQRQQDHNIKHDA